MKKVSKSDAEWQTVLTREEYRILRKSHTERPFSGKYNDHHEKGIYDCAACGTPLFGSEAKYDHGSGWPSFIAPVDETHVEYRDDKSFGMTRTEVTCAACRYLWRASFDVLAYLLAQAYQVRPPFFM